jgi:hypothetical protein
MHLIHVYGPLITFVIDMHHYIDTAKFYVLCYAIDVHHHWYVYGKQKLFILNLTLFLQLSAIPCNTED